MQEQSSKSEPDVHRKVIKQIVDEMEGSIGTAQSLSNLCAKHALDKRRVYDLFNVFQAIGCCEKISHDLVLWYGKEKAKEYLAVKIREREILNSKQTLEELFPPKECVGLGNLSLNMCLMFFALMNDRLDLRLTAQLFAKGTDRYKSTLCKLYQVSYTLGAADITTRTEKICEVILNPPYFDRFPVASPLSIASLLNHKGETTAPNDPGSIFARRREELREIFMRSRTSQSITEYSLDTMFDE